MNIQHGDFFISDFAFHSGEVLPELRLHYRTLGEPRRDAQGSVRNAVLILHGTTGSGQQFLRESFAGELFGPGQLLDAGRHYIILPDGIGHGGSSKPSDGMRMRFPRYGYRDMVRAQHLLLTDGLGIDHLHIVMGTSMGGMHTWLWGQLYPDFMDYLVPLASLPAEIAGRNRMIRKMIMDSIRQDPAWQNGEYREQPPGLIGAIHLMIIMGSCPLQWQKEAPTRDEADRFLAERIGAYQSQLDANDMLYQVGASEDYDPAPDYPGSKRRCSPSISLTIKLIRRSWASWKRAYQRSSAVGTSCCRSTSIRAVMGRIPWPGFGSIIWRRFWAINLQRFSPQRAQRHRGTENAECGRHARSPLHRVRNCVLAISKL